MKRLISILLLFVFLFNIVGYVLLFYMQQHNVKQRAELYRNNFKNYVFKNYSENLLKITIKKSDIKSVYFKDNGKEMFHNNELYDIISSNELNDEIIFYCMSDKQEKELLANLADHVDSNLVDGKNVHKSSSKKISTVSLKFFSEQNQFLFSVFRNINSVSYISFKINYTPALIEVKSPPPELA